MRRGLREIKQKRECCRRLIPGEGRTSSRVRRQKTSVVSRI